MSGGRRLPRSNGMSKEPRETSANRNVIGKYVPYARATEN